MGPPVQISRLSPKPWPAQCHSPHKGRARIWIQFCLYWQQGRSRVCKHSVHPPYGSVGGGQPAFPLPDAFLPPTLLSVGDVTDSLNKLSQCYLPVPVGGWDGRLPMLFITPPPASVLESVGASLELMIEPSAGSVLFASLFPRLPFFDCFVCPAWSTLLRATKCSTDGCHLYWAWMCPGEATLQSETGCC